MEPLSLPVGLYRRDEDAYTPSPASFEVHDALTAHLYLDGLILMPDLPAEGPPEADAAFPADLPTVTDYAGRFLLAHLQQDPLDGTQWRRPLYTPVQSWDCCYALGYRHMTEWAAFTVERMQRRYEGALYDVLPVGPRPFLQTSYRDWVHHSTHPEGAVVDAAAAAFVGFNRESFGAETVLTLLDTTLMLDPIVSAPLPAPTVVLNEPYNPWATFFRVLGGCS